MQMIGMKKTRLRAAENARARVMPEEVAHVVADNRGAHQHSAQQVKVQPAGGAGKADREEKRIAGKKEACQQARFREDDSEQPGDAERARQQSARQLKKPLGVV